MNANLAYDDWQEKARVELINGKPVMMSPPSMNHLFTSDNICRIFGNYLNGKRCTPISDGPMVYLTEKDHFIPDFMVVCDPDKIKPDGVHGAPDLVVEILSPSTANNDRVRKKNAYEAAGIQEYWIVSPGDKFVEQYILRNGGLILDTVYTLHPDWELARMTEEERAALVTQFKCSLFDDLDISLADIFYRTF